MLRLSRAAQLPMRRLAHKPVAPLTYALRHYSVPPKTHFQKGDTPPEPNTSSGPKSYFQGGDTPPPPSGAAGRYIVSEPAPKGRFWMVLLALAVISGGSAWYLLFSNNFSPEVAALLRKALKAESDSFGGQNLQDAVRYYIEALMMAEEQGMSPISDEYTGIQLKLAEMYEMLNYPDAATDVYMEICMAYFDAFQKNQVPVDRRPDIVQRGLRVALKLAHAGGKEGMDKARRALELQIQMAQEEVGRRLPPGAEALRQLMNEPHTKTGWPPRLMNASAQANQLRRSGELEAWMPFRDELIAARDLLTTFNLGADMPDQAIREKQVTYQMMLASGCGVGELLLAQANLGSMLYLMAEKMEALVAAADKSGGTIKFSNGVDVPRNLLQPGNSMVLTRAEVTYKRVLDGIQKLEPEVRRTKEVEEAQALCTYGVGVINIKKGEYEQAKDYLREARTRAKGSGFEDLVLAADGELEKVDKLAAEAAEAPKDKESSEASKPKISIHDLIANNVPTDNSAPTITVIQGEPKDEEEPEEKK
ncbi:Protein MRG3-like protein [Yarrowia sp. B02]|nr:Protein MRG3-like protein [Yarrowia sp. B02]